jgi:hypothetical protein
MGTVSRSGWIIKTAIDYGRRFHIVSPNDPQRDGEMLTPAVVRQEIIDRLNMVVHCEEVEADKLEPGEKVWLFSEKKPDGTFGTHSIRFVGPDWLQIRRLKSIEAKKRQDQKDARRERAEIARETCSAGKSRRPQASTAPSTSRRL